MQRQDPTCFDFFWTQKIRIVGCSYELWIYQFVFIVTVRRVALFICVEINVTRLRRKGVTFKNEINGRSSEDIFVCTQAVRPINIAAVPRNPSQCGAFIFLFVQKKRKLNGFREKSMIVLFSIFINIEPWEPGLVQNRTENQNKFAKERGVSKHGTISHFAIAKTGHGFNWNWGSLFGLNCVGLRTWNQ